MVVASKLDAVDRNAEVEVQISSVRRPGRAVLMRAAHGGCGEREKITQGALLRGKTNS